MTSVIQIYDTYCTLYAFSMKLLSGVRSIHTYTIHRVFSIPIEERDHISA